MSTAGSCLAKKIPVDAWEVERIFDRFNAVSNEYPRFFNFTVYRANYKLVNLVNDNVISNLLGGRGYVEEPHFCSLPERLEECVEDIRFLSDPREDRDFEADEKRTMETTWRALKLFYGLDRPIEELKKLDVRGHDIMSLTAGYDDYFFRSRCLESENCMIALYPDGQTFAVLIFPRNRIWDDQTSFWGDY